jgi:hypothetical protein
MTELIRDYWSQIVLLVGGIIAFVVFRTRTDIKLEIFEQRMKNMETIGSPFARENILQMKQEMIHLEGRLERADTILLEMGRKVNEMHTSIKVIENILTKDK